MRTPGALQVVASAVVLVWAHSAYAQHVDDATEIQQVLDGYFKALSDRDAAAVRSLLAEQFVAIDTVTRAGHKNARIAIVDTADDKSLLPPDGNDDMVGLRVASVKIHFSDSNPVVAAASIEASSPVSEEFMAHYREWLALDPSDAAVEGEDYTAARAKIENIVEKRHMQLSFLAMLGRENGNWRIITMAYPD